MSERAKKPHTDAVALQFVGPAVQAEQARQAMLAFGFREAGDSMPWREAFSYTDDELPGVFLSGARYREGLTQVQLSERTGIPRRHISEMEHGRRPIGKQNARKLGEALGVDPRRFLRV